MDLRHHVPVSKRPKTEINQFVTQTAVMSVIIQSDTTATHHTPPADTCMHATAPTMTGGPWGVVDQMVFYCGVLVCKFDYVHWSQIAVT
jgi:hypothetical protein